MARNFPARFIVTMLLLAPSLGWAKRYRIEPKLQGASAEEIATNPFAALSIPSAVKILSLLNFVVDQEPEQEIGVDYPKYNRAKQFGNWIVDNPHENCFDTRAVILMRDSQEQVTLGGKNGCRVQTGLWNDVYSGQQIWDAAQMQVDHVVPLKNAYVAGAWKWDKKRRCHYANFTTYDSHLLSVSGAENGRKGDRSPAKYMPSNQKFSCAYLQRWLNVKAVWDLTLDEEEAASVHQLMAAHNCSVQFQTVQDSTLRDLQAHADRIESRCLDVRESEEDEY